MFYSIFYSLVQVPSCKYFALGNYFGEFSKSAMSNALEFKRADNYLYKKKKKAVVKANPKHRVDLVSKSGPDAVHCL